MAANDGKDGKDGKDFPQDTDAIVVGRSWLKYHSVHHIQFSDRLLDGFYDCGRRRIRCDSVERTALWSDSEIIQSYHNSDDSETECSQREILYVDSTRDTNLNHWIKSIAPVIVNAKSERDKILSLAQLVWCQFGPICDGKMSDGDIMSKIWRQTKLSQIPVIMLGQTFGLTGVCRHKATLFKYAADHVKGIRAALVRGWHHTGPVSNMHVWCMTEIDNKLLIVELSVYKFSIDTILIPIDSPRAKDYVVDAPITVSRFFSVFFFVGMDTLCAEAGVL
jgi:hypothetical protein